MMHQVLYIAQLPTEEELYTMVFLTLCCTVPIPFLYLLVAMGPQGRPPEIDVSVKGTCIHHACIDD